jgi:hypothetical protein
MATYNRVAGAGNNNASKVIRVTFSVAPYQAPFLKAWDNSNCNSTTGKVFTGTSGNGNEPVIIAKETTSGAPGSNWVTSVTKASGGANANKLKGDTYYVNFPNTNTTQYFNIALLLPSDFGGDTYTFTLQVGGYFSSSPTITFSFNNQTNGGTEASPSWTTWGNYSAYYSSSGSSTSSIIPIFLGGSNTINEEMWIQTA